MGGMPGLCLMGLSPLPGRYHRLPLPEQGAPLEAEFDAFVSVLRVSQGRRGWWEHRVGTGACRAGLGLGPVSMVKLRASVASGFPQSKVLCRRWNVRISVGVCICTFSAARAQR